MSEYEAVLRELTDHYRRECELLQRHKTIPIDYRHAFFCEEVELAKKLILMGKTDVVVAPSISTVILTEVFFSLASNKRNMTRAHLKGGVASVAFAPSYPGKDGASLSSSSPSFPRRCTSDNGMSPSRSRCVESRRRP